VIGGRATNFMALDGKTGSVLWKYRPQYENDSILKHARFNFNSSVLVPDRTATAFRIFSHQMAAIHWLSRVTKRIASPVC